MIKSAYSSHYNFDGPPMKTLNNKYNLKLNSLMLPFLSGERLEVSLHKNLNCLQLASVSLLRPLHSLPQGSGLSAFIRRSNSHLPHLNSDLTSLSSGFSLSVCPSSSLTFFSEASASWLHSKYCFDQQQGNPFIAKWNPNTESAGNFSHRSMLQ